MSSFATKISKNIYSKTTTATKTKSKNLSEYIFRQLKLHQHKIRSKTGISSEIRKKKLYGLFFMDGVQLPQGLSHIEEAVYFLPLSPQKFLVLNLLTSEG